MPDGGCEADPAAPVVPDDRGLPDPEFVEDCDHLLGQIAGAVPVLRRLRPPEPAQQHQRLAIGGP